ncbi:MAG: outer membrane beta-barrel family protein, partial [Muribaculaceae bacterium]|nr:outer membrane beta-barrel family protein [Muribaculaceae bacterium]
MTTENFEKIALAALVWLASGNVAAQEPEDSAAVQALNEIVVKAPKVVRKADMDVYRPSRSAVENSANGLQLLGNLMIPTLSVSEALGTVKAAGQAVQLRVNGRETTVEQVKALLPEAIKRVEWIDNPGLRYGGANAVLNFVVVNPQAGGSLMTEARPALNQAWGTYSADVKVNAGRSQLDAGANFKLTDKIKSHRDYTETFTFADGTSVTRGEASRGGEVDNTMLDAWVTYSYVKPDTTVFMATASLGRNFGDRAAYRGVLSLSDGSDDVMLDDVQGSRGTTPGVSLYWQQNFKKRQTLVVNFNGSVLCGNTYSDYVERTDAPKPVTDIHTDIKDVNQAYAAEADYIISRDNARFTAGASYGANRNRSEYRNMDGAVFHQRQDKAYFFAEYFRRMGKWTATAGIGMQYTSFRFEESGRGNHSWNARPQATVTDSLTGNHNFRLNFTSWQSAPSLAETNVVP